MADRIITWSQFSNHIIPQNCWILVEGLIYNVSDFLVQHPGGDEVLIKWSGVDATEAFIKQNHSQYAKSLRNARLIGSIQKNPYPSGYLQNLQAKKKILKNERKSRERKARQFKSDITLEELGFHKSQEDCWIAVNGNVYDVTGYLDTHPGGIGKIMEYAGKDATSAFVSAGHSEAAILKKQQFKVGLLKKSSNFLPILLSGILLIVIFVWWFMN